MVSAEQHQKQTNEMRRSNRARIDYYNLRHQEELIALILRFHSIRFDFFRMQIINLKIGFHSTNLMKLNMDMI